MKYTVEKTYLVPRYRHVTVEAASAQEAVNAALANDDDPGDWKTDHECSRPEFVTGIWEGEHAYQGRAFLLSPDGFIVRYRHNVKVAPDTPIVPPVDHHQA